MEVHEIAIPEQKTFDGVGKFPFVFSPAIPASNSQDQVCFMKLGKRYPFLIISLNASFRVFF
jgi:hypothetical protein